MSFRPFLLFYVIGLSVLFAVSPAEANAAVRFSEIAWMGDTESYLNEWIELYNPSVDQHVDLTDWVIIAADGSPQIELSGSLAPGAFLLLKRGADLDYTGSLLNGGETLVLKDSSGSLIDEVSWSDGSPGDNQTKHTMERLLSGAWETSVFVGGTPGALNSVWSTLSSPALLEPSSEPEPKPEPEPLLSPSPTGGFSDELPPEDIVPAPIVVSDPLEDAPVIPLVIPNEEPVEISPETFAVLRISEILPDPEGKDSENEFVEIENLGTESAFLDGWVLRDASGASFALFGIIGSGQFIVFGAADTSLPSLNNSGDILELLDPSGVRQDGVEYGKAQKGLALARDEDGSWKWTATITPGTSNRISSAIDKDLIDDVPIVVAPVLPPKSKPFTTEELAIEDYTGSALASAIQAFSETEGKPSRIQDYAIVLSFVLSLIGGGIVFFLRRRTTRKQTQIAFAVEKESLPPVT